MRKRLDGLSALKAAACLGVFLSHVSHREFDGAGALGVSLFLITSGFTMCYNYYEAGRTIDLSPTGIIRFTYQKISKLYPLFLLTTCVMAVFLFVGNERFSLSYALFLLLTNAVFLQEWLPINFGSINGVSWFLCTVVLSYSLFPFALRRMERNYSKRKAEAAIAVMLILQLAIGLVGRFIPSPDYISGGFWRADFTNWFVYRFPVSRSIDFLIGCNLGYLFLHREANRRSKAKPYTICECLIAGGGYCFR